MPPNVIPPVELIAWLTYSVGEPSKDIPPDERSGTIAPILAEPPNVIPPVDDISAGMAIRLNALPEIGADDMGPKPSMALLVLQLYAGEIDSLTGKDE